MSPAGSPIERRNGYLHGAGGVRIFYRVWKSSEPRGRVIGAHGLGEHSGRLEGVARVLAAAGWSVWALDQRGHGRSGGRRGHADDLESLLRDLDRLRRRAGPLPRPLFLLGHSLGGLVVLRYLQEFGPPGLRGAVLIGPYLELAREVPDWKLRLGRVADRWFPTLTLESGIEREEVVRDPKEVKRLEDDPLTHRRISARLWGEMRRHAALAGQRAGRTSAPTLVQIPGDDRVAAAEATRELAARLPAARTETYPDAFHDLLHDPVREAALADALEWMEERVGETSPRRGSARSPAG